LTSSKASKNMILAIIAISQDWVEMAIMTSINGMAVINRSISRWWKSKGIISIVYLLLNNRSFYRNCLLKSNSSFWIVYQLIRRSSLYNNRWKVGIISLWNKWWRTSINLILVCRSSSYKTWVLKNSRSFLNRRRRRKRRRRRWK